MGGSSLSFAVVVVALFSVLGGLSFGYNTIIIAAANPIIAIEFGLKGSKLFEGLITSTILIGAMIGSLGGGIVASKFGRKMSNAVGSTFQIFGILAANIYIFLIARAVVGAGIGITAVVCPLYVSENAEPSRRGVMGVLFQLSITFGILVSNFVGWGLAAASSIDPTIQWRLMLGLGVILPLGLLILTLVYMKEPKKVDQSEIIENINITFNPDIGTSSSKKTLVMGFIMETVLAFILQFTGINAVMNYGPKIIAAAGGFFNEYSNAFNIGIGFFNFVFTIVAILLVERLGRKPLMVFGTGVMSLALIAIGVLAIPSIAEQLVGTKSGIATLICLITFIMGFEIGPGCLFWVLVNENFPVEHAKYKETAATYANVLQWILNLVVCLVFPVVQPYPLPTFLFFGGVGVISTIYLIIFMKETRQ